MASEKITAIVEFPLLLLPLRLLLALLLLLRKRRPSSMLSWLMSALTRCRSSRLLRS